MSSVLLRNVRRSLTYCSERRTMGRRGLSLVEMMVVITLSSMLVGIVVTFAVSLMQSDRRMRSATVASDQLAVLAATLRSDMRLARDVTLRDNAKQLVVTFPERRRAEYTCDSEGCQRKLLDADESPSRSDLFRVEAAVEWKIERLRPGRRPLLAIVLERASSRDPAAKLPPLLVYAALGADNSWENAGGER